MTSPLGWPQRRDPLVVARRGRPDADISRKRTEWGSGRFGASRLPRAYREASILARSEVHSSRLPSAVASVPPPSAVATISRSAGSAARKLARAGLKPQTKRLLELLQRDPFATAPRFEKPVGNLAGFYSRRVNIQHRLVYRVDADRKIVHVLRMWTHYE